MNDDKDITNEHEFKETVEIDVWYPDHSPRTESALFSKTKKHFIKVLDTPCWVCGSKIDREIHHYFVEWAFADGVDWDKMHILHPNFDWSTFKNPEDFVDSAYNMMVLCATHHRHKNHGIHYIPFPFWVMQLNKKQDFILTEDEIVVSPVVPTDQPKE